MIASHKCNKNMSIIFTKKKIKLQKFLGDRLKTARKRKEVNLEQAEKDTKVAMKYLHALESSNYDKLPADVYVYGFLSRYADYLGLKSDEVIKNFQDEKKYYHSIKSIKRHPDQEKKNLLKPESEGKWLKGPKYYITPELAIGVFVAVVVIGLLGYIWFQVKSFAAAPPLEINNKEAEIVVMMDKITISGKTDSTADLNINGEAVAVEPDGNFSEEIQLEKGINTIEITARNKAQKETTKRKQIL